MYNESTNPTNTFANTFATTAQGGDTFASTNPTNSYSVGTTPYNGRYNNGGYNNGGYNNGAYNNGGYNNDGEDNHAFVDAHGRNLDNHAFHSGQYTGHYNGQYGQGKKLGEQLGEPGSDVSYTFYLREERERQQQERERQQHSATTAAPSARQLIQQQLRQQQQQQQQESDYELPERRGSSEELLVKKSASSANNTSKTSHQTTSHNASGDQSINGEAKNNNAMTRSNTGSATRIRPAETGEQNGEKKRTSLIQLDGPPSLIQTNSSAVHCDDSSVLALTATGEVVKRNSYGSTRQLINSGGSNHNIDDDQEEQNKHFENGVEILNNRAILASEGNHRSSATHQLLSSGGSKSSSSGGSKPSSSGGSNQSSSAGTKSSSIFGDHCASIGSKANSNRSNSNSNRSCDVSPPAQGVGVSTTNTSNNTGNKRRSNSKSSEISSSFPLNIPLNNTGTSTIQRSSRIEMSVCYENPYNQRLGDGAEGGAAEGSSSSRE